jgi:serine/threonine protein kinase
MTELQSGVFLGHYELLVRIGRGGMASVWVARERSAVSGKERYVAVKAMLPELARHSEFRSMFLSEVQIIQSIQHDNVVRVFEVSEDRGVLYMAMEWVEGDSLRNIVRASRGMGALPPEIAVCIAADAAAGLQAAHELGTGTVNCGVSFTATFLRTTFWLAWTARPNSWISALPALSSSSSGRTRKHSGQGQLHVTRAGARLASRQRPPTCSRSESCSTR